MAETKILHLAILTISDLSGAITLAAKYLCRTVANEAPETFLLIIIVNLRGKYLITVDFEPTWYCFFLSGGEVDRGEWSRFY